MKILGILGSPHPRGNTAILLDAALEGARAAGAEVERISIAGLTLKYCAGCARCYRDGRCVNEDDVEIVKEKMLAADGILLGSPVYIRTVSGQLKTIMDRCAYFVHCQSFLGKYGASVATAGGSLEDETAEFQNGFLQMCGAQTVGAVGAKGAGHSALVDQDAAVERAKALGKTLAAAIAEKRDYPEQAPAHQEMFEQMRQLVAYMGDAYPAQYNHWKEKGWL